MPFYDSNLITFGGAYKNMYVFEADWVLHFEELLAKLCWHRASAFLDFGGLRCNWEAEGYFERTLGETPSPLQKWSKSFLKLSETEITFDNQ